MADIVKDVGFRIRELREDRGLSLWSLSGSSSSRGDGAGA
jgi:ribosome-binding protein aMBF1 (putative translation factor)